MVRQSKTPLWKSLSYSPRHCDPWPSPPQGLHSFSPPPCPKSSAQSPESGLISGQSFASSWRIIRDHIIPLREYETMNHTKARLNQLFWILGIKMVKFLSLWHNIHLRQEFTTRQIYLLQMLHFVNHSDLYSSSSSGLLPCSGISPLTPAWGRNLSRRLIVAFNWILYHRKL